ncbi:MAG: flagellar basal body L-ring protein [Cellvibrio sp.]|jgi:flagellar L-ring protein precursor FlgH|nr:flagellar basal body L-ring protein [Cellvibrio sp.]
MRTFICCNAALPKKMALVLMLIGLSGCFTNTKPIPDDPAYAPTIASNMVVPQRTEGALYQDIYGLNLFDDRKAHFVGDVITVTLSERTVSRKSSGVATGKKSGVDFNAGPLLGANPTIKGREFTTTLEQDRTFDGSADADQSNSLQGNITVTIAEILPNGNLMVRGEKWITLNRGDEFIRISGLVRPEDIAPDNTILSTRLANAKISYSGTGALADASSMGWLSRFFNSALWPL